LGLCRPGSVVRGRPFDRVIGKPNRQRFSCFVG
jgi:hypothetical protein